MLEKLTKKNERGFTLAELLVVVAIIAILVAVSIPIFTSQLEKSREATDVANMRAAKASATIAVLDATTAATSTWYYDADKGSLAASKAAAGTPYGKGTAKEGGTTAMGYDDEWVNDGKVVKVVYTQTTGSTEIGDGTFAITWE